MDIESKRIKVFINKIKSWKFSFFLILTYPFHFFSVPHPWQYLKNLFAIVFGKYSFVGYDTKNQVFFKQLPKIKKGVLNFGDLSRDHRLFSSTPEKFNLIYAKDYNIRVDLYLIRTQFKKLGKKV